MQCSSAIRTALALLLIGNCCAYAEDPTLVYPASLQERDGQRPAAKNARPPSKAVPSVQPKTGPVAPAPQGTSPAVNQIAVEPQRNRAAEPSLASFLGLNETRYHSDRLYSTPNMFGDFFLSGLYGGGSGTAGGGTFGATMFAQVQSGNEAFLLAGGAGRLSIADNNKAVTQDRVYFLYNHFHNAIESSGFVTSDLPGQEIDTFYYEQKPIDRYTVGVERTLLDGLLSAELRVPWTGNGSDRIMGPVAFDRGEMGNLSLVFKTMLFESSSAAVATGVGIEVPTGSDAELRSYPGAYRLHNETTYLIPYLAVTGAPTRRLFYHGFAQVNVPAKGNRLTYSDPNLGPSELGILNDPTLLQLNLGSGYWLFRNEGGYAFRGLASALELHYTSTLSNADFALATVTYSDATTHYWSHVELSTLGPAEQRRDLLDMTVGLHADLADGWLARVGTSVPLREDRTFDAEVIVQVERRF